MLEVTAAVREPSSDVLEPRRLRGGECNDKAPRAVRVRRRVQWFALRSPRADPSADVSQRLNRACDQLMPPRHWVRGLLRWDCESVL